MSFLKIKKINKRISNKEKVFDLCFDKDHYFFVKGNNNTYIKVHNSMADIDWDSEQGARDKILEYLVATYGREAVCNVVTYGTYGPKSALSDMSRGLRKDTGHDTILMRKINKLPELDDAEDLVGYFNNIKRLNTDPEINSWIAGNQDTIGFANKLVGQMKSIGVHAGGIVVTPGPIYDYIPVTKGSGNLVTAFSEADGSSKDLSELGILKLDVLGLKTLNVLKECVERIQIDKGIDLKEKIFHLPLDDKKMIDYFSSGNNYGIFQMDRSAMFTSQFRRDGGEVDSFEDIVAINAMNRPGPLEKFLPKYGFWKAIDQKKVELSKEEIEEVDKERYPFPFMKGILSSTFGTCLYQDELIYNPKNGSFKKIKDIVDGDFVFSKIDNSYKLSKNKKTLSNGIKEVFTYKLKTGYTINVTADHVIDTVYGEMEIQKAFDSNIPLLIPKKLDVYDIKEKINNERARLIGLMIADGCMKGSNLGLTNSNTVLLDNFESLIGCEFPECKIVKRKMPNRKSVYFYSVSGVKRKINTFNDFIIKIGLKHKGSKDKFIPLDIFSSADEVKLHVLSGLWDGDGGVNKIKAYYKTVSERLAFDIVTLCRQLGMLPIIYCNKNIYQIDLRRVDYERFVSFMSLTYKKVLPNYKRELFNCFPMKYVDNLIRETGKTRRQFFISIGVTKKAPGTYYNGNMLDKIINKLGGNDIYDNCYSIPIVSSKSMGLQPVYDLSIECSPWFVAGYAGITVHNCLYQEQIMQIVCELTGMNFGEADSFRRAIAWKKDNPKYHTVSKYFDMVESSMLEKGYNEQDKEYFLKYLKDASGYNFNRSHSVCYSYISWQTLYFKVYYPAYFYSAMLNIEDKEDKIQEIIDDAKKNAIRILPLSISKSEYLCRAADDESIQLGYKLIRGCGDAVEDEIKTLEMHKCTTIDEIMQKPFKKINKTVLDNLIRLGCFDEFGIDRGMIEILKTLYKEPKIEKWFTRKRSPGEEKTMPEILSESFDTSIVMSLVPVALESSTPHTTLVNLLTPYLKIEDKEDPEKKKLRLQKETITAETELMGFSISVDDSFNDFARAFRSAGFKAISDFDEDDPKCYFKVAKITELKTKTGKMYWQYTLNDGRKEFKAKVWRHNPKISEGCCSVGVLSSDPKWGWTLEQCEFVKS